MSIMHRYIAKMVIVATSLVLLVMVGLTFLINFLEELRDMGTGDYGFSQVLLHVLLNLPHNLYQFFPMLMLLGGVLGLGVLASNQELVVMRAAGFSVRRIAVAVLSAALLLTGIATLIGEVVVPRANYLAESHKQSAENGGQAVATLSGVWIHEGNNFLHIERVMGLHHLEGVTRYQFDGQHHLLAAYHVKALDFHNDQWLLHDVVKTTFSDNRTISQFMKKTSWDLTLNPNLLVVGLIEPEEMSLITLHDYAQHLKQNGLQASAYQWEFWKRIFQPLMTLIMILLAIPFVLRSSRTVTTGWRVLFAISVGFTCYILNALLGQFSIVFQFSPLLAAMCPVVLFACVGYVFARRMVV
jgi:lipopolysaccharide export system permease protein